MQVGDLVRHGPMRKVGVVVSAGSWSKYGAIWWVLFGKRQVSCFQDDMKVINASR